MVSKRKSILLLSDDMLGEIWTYLSTWESDQLALDLITERAAFANIPLDAALGEEKAKSLAYCLRNARECIRPPQAEFIPRIVTRYYGCMWLVSGSLPSVEKKVIGLTETLADTMSRHQRTVGETLTHNSELTRSSLEEVTKGLSRITAATEQQVKDLESKLGEVLEECLSSLGSQLTTLSERFVEDYTPLTTRLRQLVHMTPAE